MFQEIAAFREFVKDLLEKSGLEPKWIDLLTSGIFFAIIVSICLIYLYKLYKWIEFRRKQVFLRRDLHPFFTEFEIDKATRYFIQTKYQDTSPAEGDEPGRRFIDSPKGKLIKMFLRVAFSKDDDRFYLILADSGMGKTTFMINLYLRYKKQWRWGRPKYNIRLLPLGNPNVLHEVDQIKDQESTILLLDALDEDQVAIHDFKGRLNEILEKTWRFRKVVITSRTQFFPSALEEPHETGFFKHGTDGGEFYFRKAYVSVFDDWDIWKYLLKRYNIQNPLNWRHIWRARHIIDKSPNLMIRPMLLQHVRDLENADRNFDFTHQIYQALIDKWLEREAKKPGIKQKYGSTENFKQKLDTFSQRLAVNLYENREKRGGLKIHKDETIATTDLQLADLDQDFAKLHLRESEWRSRSLLNRDGDGYYKFSHKSILEYYLAKEATTNDDFFKALKISGMEAANVFMLDMFFEKEIEKWGKQNVKMSRVEWVKSLAIGVNTAEAWNNLGNAYNGKEEYDKAIECYQKAISIKKDYHHAWNGLGNAYSDKEEYDKAIECYQKAISIKKDYHYAWNGLGYIYNNKEEYDKAIECCQKAISIKKDYHHAWNGLGYIYNNKEEYDEAIECCQKAISIKKDYHHAWNGLGNAYRYKEQYDKAIECCQKAISIKKDYHYAWDGLGNAYNDKEEYDKAIECYEKAISIKKDYHFAWNGLGNTYSDKEEYDKAIECYEKAISIKKDYYQAWNNLGCIYLQIPSYPNAENALKKAWELSKNRIVGPAMNLGHFYLFQQNHSQSLEWYNTSLELFKDKNAFFKGMEGDFNKLKMPEREITQEQFNQILEQLRRGLLTE